MPRKLLRVALVAAVFPALIPVESSAQSGKIEPSRSTASGNSQGAGAPGWMPRLRSPKPGNPNFQPSTEFRYDPIQRKVVRIGAPQPVAQPTPAAAPVAAPAAIPEAELQAVAVPVQEPAPVALDNTRANPEAVAVGSSIATPTLAAAFGLPVAPSNMDGEHLDLFYTDPAIATAVSEPAFEITPSVAATEVATPVEAPAATVVPPAVTVVPQTAAAGISNPFETESVTQAAPPARKRRTRIRPTIDQVHVAEAAPVEQAVATPVATPVEEAPAVTARVVSTPTADDFENAFPDDVPTTRRGRRAAATQQEIATPVVPQVATVAEPEVATVADEYNVPEAFPIEAAAPPADVTAEYNAPQGAVPQYDRAGMMDPVTPAAPDSDVNFSNTTPARPIGRVMNGMNGAAPVAPAPVTYQGHAGYARLDGALYPSPQPGIPFDVGSTMITNPAFDPHEMLYAHRYRGLYGPFYHKTHRSWVLTPFGVCKSEKRILMGTEVRVNYKSHISPFSLFWPPVSN